MEQITLSALHAGLNLFCAAQEPVPGYINSRKYVDDGRQKILEPHQRMLHKTLNSQVESRKVRIRTHRQRLCTIVRLCGWFHGLTYVCTAQVRKEEEKAEVTEYEQLQNELLMKDMELRQSYVKESVMNEAATLRQAWQKQLAMKRKTDVVHKVNEDIITNVNGDVLQTMG